MLLLTTAVLRAAEYLLLTDSRSSGRDSIQNWPRDPRNPNYNELKIAEKSVPRCCGIATLVFAYACVSKRGAPEIRRGAKISAASVAQNALVHVRATPICAAEAVRATGETGATGLAAVDIGSIHQGENTDRTGPARAAASDRGGRVAGAARVDPAASGRGRDHAASEAAARTSRQDHD